MIDELDLLAEHIDRLVGPTPELEGARERLLEAIDKSPASSDRHGRRQTNRRRVTGLSLVVAAAVIVLALVMVGSGRSAAPKRSTPKFPVSL